MGRREQLAHAPEVVLDHIEIDHQARRLGLLLSEITENTLGHRWGVPRLNVGLCEGVSTATYGAKGSVRQPILDGEKSRFSGVANKAARSDPTRLMT